MTLDQAITHEDKLGKGTAPHHEEHQQMAAWLRELRDRRRSTKNLKKLKQLWDMTHAWVIKNKVLAEESIYQMDSVIFALPDLAEGACKLVGFCPLEEYDK